MTNIFSEVDRYISNEDWDEVMHWAENNHDTTDELTAKRLWSAMSFALIILPLLL
ncbi:MAG: hypothetical protein LUG95_02475 [Clostridiales bacterium]|nr:hypothetical protein [Clostridiales bacterium]